MLACSEADPLFSSCSEARSEQVYCAWSRKERASCPTSTGAATIWYADLTAEGAVRVFLSHPMPTSHEKKEMQEVSMSVDTASARQRKQIGL